MDSKEKRTEDHNVFDYANYGKDLEKLKPKTTSLSKENSIEIVKTKPDLDQKQERDTHRVPRYALKPAGNLIEKSDKQAAPGKRVSPARE